MKRYMLAVLITVVGLMGSSMAAFAGNVRTDYDHTANFSQYNTYSWGKVQTSNPFFVNRIQQAVDKELQAKGWQLNATGGSVTVFATDNIHDQQEVQTMYDNMGSGWGVGWGWGGWGWGPNWFGGGIFIDYSFFHRYGFGEFHGDIGRGAWAHDPEHRLGVAYPNRELSGRYGGGSERLGGEEPHFNRGENEPRLGRENSSRLGNPGFEDRGYTSKHSVFGGYHDGGATRMQSDHGFSSIGAGRAAGGFGGGGFGGGRRR